MHLRSLQEFERNVKYLWRLGSWDLARHWADQPSHVRSFKFGGHPFYHRTGTDDLSALNEVLFPTGAKSEWH
ncbi:MAG TPA: hypothetical protein PLX89_14250 [Verrucomicrobiota bacterium]|nr:hypothetical protein [Verrucomicrobiales bacterium]HRI14153.1 hypothetical protein [Verrucomicrobiota bacterium]